MSKPKEYYRGARIKDRRPSLSSGMVDVDGKPIIGIPVAQLLEHAKVSTGHAGKRAKGEPGFKTITHKIEGKVVLEQKIYARGYHPPRTRRLNAKARARLS